MIARMEKVRQALTYLGRYSSGEGWTYGTDHAAALAELEVWEARQAELEEVLRTGGLLRNDLLARVQAAEAEVASLQAEFSTRIFHYDERVAELEGQLRRAKSSVLGEQA